MCGITGIFGNLRKDEFDSSIYKMSSELFHRGPDDYGVWIDENNGIAFGHRRLSILDLSFSGHQPMVSPCGRFTIIFNGEIYNHLQLRDRLNGSANNYSWIGHSDTETLVYAFSKWGIDKTLKNLVGMFAIAVWDSKSKELFLIRDRFGEKPLYYGWSGKAFIFGSELKSLRSYKYFNSRIDRKALSIYMQHVNVPAPYSIFQNVYKLEPGCILKISKNGTYAPPTSTPFSPFDSDGFSIKYWYSLSEVAKFNQKNCINDDVEAIELLETALEDSVRSQLISDVPLGAFLSGGIDSSIIVSLMQKLSINPVKTFTIGFEDEAFNEAKHAAKVAKYLGTDHNELYVTADEAYKVIPDLCNLYDEPFADSSQIPTYLVSKMARQNVKVALSGDAGDEFFGGYNRYLWGTRIWNKLKFMPSSLRHVLGSAMQKVPVSTWDHIGTLLPNRYSINLIGDKAHKLAYRLKYVNSIDDVYRSLVTEGYKKESLVYGGSCTLETRLNNAGIVSGMSDPEHRMMLWDSLTYLPDDILTKVDRAAMGVSLETRMPFLDHRVVELAWRLPLDMKIRNGQGKWPIRQILYKYVPKDLIERPKAGFAIPVGQWIRGPLRGWTNDLLNEQRIQREGYFNADAVKIILEQHMNGSHDWSHRLWAILMFQSWVEKM
ncbi:asparagine synthase (glutamine-hydrolyzing) [Candidatus Woesearchaeota archaeon]|jgi:asparagine synthase (glutamine-hydrolysing)|nr:asparagine synthase (glutamine-hydrolyzing) [Candidatus Woesearchaeota archaeon]